MRRGKRTTSLARTAIAAVAVAAPVHAGYAQDLDRRLEALEQEVAALKEDLAAQRRGDTPGLVITRGEAAVALSGYLQTDARTTFHAAPAADEFYVRRARLVIRGRLGRVAEFYVSPEFTNATLYDGYIDLKPSHAVQLKVGKFKVPFGLELLQSAATLVFAERGLTYDLVPNRDIGLAVHGRAGGVEYAVGVFNGVQDGGRGEGDANDSKSLAVRVFDEFGGSGPLAGLGLGVAGTWSAQGEATPPSFKTSIAQTTFFTYRSGVAAAGRHTRLAPQASYYHGPFGALAEYVRSAQVLARTGGGTARVANTAWQTAVSWVVTGEDATDKGVTPRNPVSLDDWLAGAVQVALRYAVLNVDGAAFGGGGGSLADPMVSARAAHELSVGVNWYLDRRLRVLLDASHARFSGGARGGEWAAVARLQATF